MRELRFFVEDQRLQKDPDCNFTGLISGTKGYYTCMFSFTKEWREMAKAASFRNGAIIKYVPIRNGRCQIPDELMHSSRIKISVIGKDGDIVIMTNETPLFLQKQNK